MSPRVKSHKRCDNDAVWVQVRNVASPLHPQAQSGCFLGARGRSVVDPFGGVEPLVYSFAAATAFVAVRAGMPSAVSGSRWR
jgi:hypothetical protein